ncbi:hypothetical protein [Streptomyces sp. NPDC059371]|uniref:hypothetical protein n=1 Tax=Streptomyces sp. NPDC059371 TaxID=3346812 RepID=UPI00368DBB5E
MTHGSIFNAIAKVRSTTKNTLIRALADQANNTVFDHITVMEKTGLVLDAGALGRDAGDPSISKGVQSQEGLVVAAHLDMVAFAVGGIGHRGCIGM